VNKKIMTKENFDSAVREYQGAFPVLLTTDGQSLNFEHDDGKGIWMPEGVVIDVINNSDLWPSYTDANRCRLLAKKGWRGQALKEQIDSHI